MNTTNLNFENQPAQPESLAVIVALLPTLTEIHADVGKNLPELPESLATILPQLRLMTIFEIYAELHGDRSALGFDSTHSVAMPDDGSLHATTR